MKPYDLVKIVFTGFSSLLAGFATHNGFVAGSVAFGLMTICFAIEKGENS